VRPRGAAVRGLSWAAVLLVGTVRVAWAQAPPEAIEYYARDAVGSVRIVFDAQGNVLGRSDYLPFGETWNQSGALPRQRFTGQARDGEAGLDDFNARAYQPLFGRFTRPDPVSGSLFAPQSWNAYAYVQNRPLVATDPSGMSPYSGWVREMNAAQLSFMLFVLDRLGTGAPEEDKGPLGNGPRGGGSKRKPKTPDDGDGGSTDTGDGDSNRDGDGNSNGNGNNGQKKKQEDEKKDDPCSDPVFASYAMRTKMGDMQREHNLRKQEQGTLITEEDGVFGWTQGTGTWSNTGVDVSYTGPAPAGWRGFIHTHPGDSRPSAFDRANFKSLVRQRPQVQYFYIVGVPSGSVNRVDPLSGASVPLATNGSWMSSSPCGVRK
jgi:RHS repeat-associated protein